MTAKELARRLDGCECKHVVGMKERSEIDAAGLVVAYGRSDDILELDGAIYGMVGVHEATMAYVKDKALLFPLYGQEDCEECLAWGEYASGAKTIKAVWHDEGDPCWTIETDIPHETFSIYDDGELFSVGIVFQVEDTRDKPASEQLADLQALWDMYGGEEGITAAFQKAAERDAAVEELRGICWCCAHGKKWDKAPALSKMTTCEYMPIQVSGALARGGGKCKCPHWEWRGPQAGGGVDHGH